MTERRPRTPKPSEEMAALLPRMFMAVNAVEARLKTSLRPDDGAQGGLTPQQMHLLMTLEAAGGSARPGDLARRLALTPATVTINAKRLVRGGYLAKTREARDERGVRLQMTAKARRVFDAHRRKTTEFFDGVFAVLPKERRRRLIEAHRVIIETFQEVARS